MQFNNVYYNFNTHQFNNSPTSHFSPQNKKHKRSREEAQIINTIAHSSLTTKEESSKSLKLSPKNDFFEFNLLLPELPTLQEDLPMSPTSLNTSPNSLSRTTPEIDSPIQNYEFFEPVEMTQNLLEENFIQPPPMSLLPSPESLLPFPDWDMSNPAELSEEISTYAEKILSINPQPIIEQPLLVNDTSDAIERQCKMIAKRYKKLTPKKHLKATGLSKEQLKKVIRIALTTPVQENGQALIVEEGQKFIIQRSRDQVLTHFYTIIKKTKLGSGGTATVDAIQDLMNGTKAAMKKAKTRFDSRIINLPERIKKGRLKIKKGYQILQQLNKDGRLEGVPPPARAYINIKGNRSYVMDYGIPITRLIKSGAIEPKLFFSSIKNLAVGIQNLQKMGFIHNDIKLDNMIFWAKEGEIVASHTDLDGGIFTDEINKKNPCGDSTIGCFSVEDSQALLNEVSQKNINKDNLILINNRQMVYAFGNALNVWIHSMIKKDFIPSDLISFIDLMSNPNHTERPTIDQVVQKFSQFVTQ